MVDFLSAMMIFVERVISMDKEFLHDFIERALVKNNKDTAKTRGEAMPLPEKPVPADAYVVQLPSPDILEDHDISFLELVECRSSIRTYSNQPLTLNDLSYLLWCTQGVKQMISANLTRRNVPSAGGRHAFETYLYIHNVEGLQPGVYRFLALGHALLPMDLADDVLDRLGPCFNHPKQLSASAVTFIWAADMARMDYLFGGRSLQYLYIDAGHVCQNLYLAGYTIQAGVCAVGHFHDHELNAFLGLDEDNDFAVYAAHVGKA